MVITSKSNPLIKETVALKDKKARKELSLFLVEGEKMCREIEKSSLRIDRVFVSESYQGTVSEDFVVVSDEVFAYLSDEKTPQGILCRVCIPKEKLTAPSGDSLILDGVSDPGNLGTILRTANAAGYKEVYLIGCTDPYSPKTVRASMSGLFFEKLYFGTAEEVLSVMKDVDIVSADMSGENIFTFRKNGKIALAIGNEANGLSDCVKSASDYTVRIPMDETQESLNAGVSAGIAMYLLKKDKFV